MENVEMRRENCKPFLKLPLELSKCKDLSLSAKIVAAAIMLHDRGKGESWPSQSKLAEVTTFSLRTVARSLKELGAKHWLEWTRRGKRCTNLYKPSAKLAEMFEYHKAETVLSDVPKRQLVTCQNGRTPRKVMCQNGTSIVIDEHTKIIEEQNIEICDGFSYFGMSSEPDSNGHSGLAESGLDHQDLANCIGHKEKNDKVTCQNGASSDNLQRVESASLKSHLRDWGVGANVADDILENFPEERIRQQLLYLPFRDNGTVRNLPGLLIKSIGKNYSAPQLSEVQAQEIKSALNRGELPVPTAAQREAFERALECWKSDEGARIEFDSMGEVERRQIRHANGLASDDELKGHLRRAWAT